MRINLYAVAYFLLCDVLSPYTCISKEETLLRSKALLVLKRFLSCSILECVERNLKTSVVSKVLTKSELTISVKTWQHLNSIEESSILLSTLVKALSIISCPPIVEHTISIILTTLIIKSVSHLMTNNNTDSTIVECFISLRIEEWILKDTCWEADLVCCWVVISINSLRSHKPLVLINWLTSLVGNTLVVSKLTTCLNILIEALRRINSKSAIVSPLIWITNLYIELIKLFVSISLSTVAHPCLSIDTLAKRNLKILDKINHNLLT